MSGKGKWAELENYIFIMTIGKLYSFALVFFCKWGEKEFNKCNSFIALVKFRKEPTTS